MIPCDMCLLLFVLIDWFLLWTSIEKERALYFSQLLKNVWNKPQGHNLLQENYLESLGTTSKKSSIRSLGFWCVILHFFPQRWTKSKIKKKKKGFKKTNRNKTFFVFCFLKSLKNICGDNTRYCHHSNSFRMMQLSLSTTWERKLRFFFSIKNLLQGLFSCFPYQKDAK